jgi:hypothetical protein
MSKVGAAAIVVTGIAGVIVALILGWGYWRVSSLADVHVSLYDVALKTDRQRYGSLLAADVEFRDADGVSLADARADMPMGVVSLIHPRVGDCRREEREGGEGWRQCYETQSRWLMTWGRRVRSARVKFDSCAIENVPVIVEQSRDRWWLWWVPAPHLDNSTSTHFDFTVWIDSAKCRAGEPIQ